MTNNNSNIITNNNYNNNNNNSVLPPEVLHQIFKLLEPKQRFCQIPVVCSSWNKASQSQPFLVDIDVSIHFSLFERYFYQNSIRSSQIQFYDTLKRVSTFPSKQPQGKDKNSNNVETVYGKCRTEIKYQPLLYKNVRNGNEIKLSILNNCDFKVQELLQEQLKKRWNILSLGKDIPHRSLIPIFKNVQIYVDSPALWFDPSIRGIFTQMIHDIFYTITPYAPERLNLGLISIPVLYEIPVNIKHLTISLLMKDYGNAIEYICNNFTQLESLELTIKSNHVFTPELNDSMKNDSFHLNIIDNKDIIERIKNNNLTVNYYNMSYLSSRMDNIIIDPENFRGLIKLKKLQKFSIHNPIQQISNIKLMYNILSHARSLKELSFSPRLLLTKVDDRNLISMIHSLVKLHQLDFENPYLELWHSIRTCKNITELSLNYTHQYLSSIVRDAPMANIGRSLSTSTISTRANTSVSFVSNTESRFNDIFHPRINRRNSAHETTQGGYANQITENFFERSIHGIAVCFPNLEKIQISWQATHFSSTRDYTISIQKIVDCLVYLKHQTKLKWITLLYKDIKLASKLEKALGKDVEINIYQ